MSSPKVAFEIGHRLGEVVEVEKRRGLESHNLFMQVKVALPLSKPLRRGGFIGGSDGQRSWITNMNVFHYSAITGVYWVMILNIMLNTLHNVGMGKKFSISTESG